MACLSPITYIVPKLLHTGEDSFRIAIDDMDVNTVLTQEATENDPWVVLLTGSRRDLELVRSVRRHPLSLQHFLDRGDVMAREGVIPGADYRVHPGLPNRRVLFDKDFPKGTELILDPKALPRMEEIRAHRMTDPTAFSLPQLIVKQAWNVKTQRFRALLVGGDEGVVPSQSYLSVHALNASGERALRAACLAFNGAVTRYLLTMGNPRMAYRSEMRVKDIYALPLPEAMLSAVGNDHALDSSIAVADLYGLRAPERALIEDALEFGVPELLGHKEVAGRKPTSRSISDEKDDLLAYADFYLKVFGDTPDSRRLSVTVFEDGDAGQFPVRMIAIHFAPMAGGRIRTEPLGGERMEEMLQHLGGMLKPGQGKFAITRVATIFDTVADPISGDAIPTAFLIRPDQRRFWTRSAAMRDADRMLAQGILPQHLGTVAK